MRGVGDHLTMFEAKHKTLLPCHTHSLHSPYKVTNKLTRKEIGNGLFNTEEVPDTSAGATSP